MSVRKRHIGRRVAGVAIGAALLVLGLEAPAFAAPPTISGFTPASGPNGCVVVLTGSEFMNTTSPIIDVEINAVDADFSVQSNTEIWVFANGQTGFITVENSLAEEATTAPTAFQDTAGVGDCAPTIASFTPTCGTVGTPVSIDGSNLFIYSGDDPTAAPPVSGFVEFSPFNPAGVGVEASHTGAPEDPTHLVVTVPAGAATGRIRVTTLVGQVLSTADFTVVTDPALCPGVQPTEHARNVTLKLSGSLRMKGKVNATDDFTDCENGVPVKLQRKKKGGGWKTLKTVTTNDTGGYSSKVKNKPGRYRSVAPRTTVGEDVCLKDISPVRKN